MSGAKIFGELPERPIVSPEQEVSALIEGALEAHGVAVLEAADLIGAIGDLARAIRESRETQPRPVCGWCRRYRGSDPESHKVRQELDSD